MSVTSTVNAAALTLAYAHDAVARGVGRTTLVALQGCCIMHWQSVRGIAQHQYGAERYCADGTAQYSAWLMKLWWILEDIQ